MVIKKNWDSIFQDRPNLKLVSEISHLYVPSNFRLKVGGWTIGIYLSIQIFESDTSSSLALDSCSKWIRQKFFKEFINKKFIKWLYSFTCILPDYVCHESSKEFWKNTYFENMRAVFLLRFQNPLWWEISFICH